MPAIRTNDDQLETQDRRSLPSRRTTRAHKPWNKNEMLAARPSPSKTRRDSSETSSTLTSLPSTEESIDDAVDVDFAQDASSGSITICGIELRPSIAFDTFWRFSAERKAIDDRRRAGLPAPWTDDPILQKYFFCNTYRVLDKGCQFIIGEVIEKGSQDPEEVVFRVILFNLFTKIETWELLYQELGPLTWKDYNREKYAAVLAKALKDEITLYTGAFIKPAPHFGFRQNYLNHLCFLECLMENQLASRLLIAPYMADVYEHLISFPSMGPFSTYQLMLCLSYTKVLNFHENDFVISGPGSISGLNKIFGRAHMEKGRSHIPQFDAEVMKYLAKTQNIHFHRLGLDFSGLGTKKLPMSLADIEHTLCEVDKYCRVAHSGLKGKRTNISRNFSASNAKSYGPPIIPKAWSHPARRLARIRPEKKLVVEKRYVVSRIGDHCDGPNGRQFFVFWEGYPDSDATWEFESSLKDDAPVIVAEYLSAKNLN
ncbi:hypothetical protein BDN70DRAFT_836922 [Pholiota conissans]|uniref:Chromo domain-containing protein n=1 Tax=Pholiota conissans TaxID=109636 RepID=A0A9P6CSA6_9AGAR|nr:hypothetical protein BDN70DRAFT_836922 [Pholiota conissans]